MTHENLTISSRYYTDPAYYEIEKEKILYRTWQFACHRTDIPGPGSFHTVQIGDESIVILHGEDGEIRAFYNVCRHRAHRITEGSGQCKRLSCPYHAWTYNLDGTLFRAPGTEDVEGFDPETIRLRPVRVEGFCGLMFVNLDDEATAMDELYPGLQEEILDKKPTLPNVVRVYEDRVRHECNWKVSVENYSECYHCPVAHKYITSNIYSGTEYRISVEDGIIRHFSPRLNEREIHGDLHIWFLWPNFAIQIFPIYRSISLRHFQGLGHRETDYVYSWYVDPDLTDSESEEVAELGRSTHHSNNGLEDQNIVRNVQLGLESRSYDQGQLIITPNPSAQSELAVGHFQKRYLQAISGASA